MIEWATALLFLGGAVIGWGRLRRLGAGWRDVRWLIPILSLLAMLDEVGWVVFALGVPPPVVLGKRFDALHDIFEACKAGRPPRIRPATLTGARPPAIVGACRPRSR